MSKRYNKKEDVISNINIKINDGEIFGFLGPNGAGKTTLIKMIVGILGIDKGDIFINGNSITKKPLECKKIVGYISDNSDVFLNLKGIEYLEFISEMYSTPTNVKIKNIEKYSKIFNMYDSLNRKIAEYSHGMRQKIMIIGALINNPKVLILDEPITGLDPKSIYNLKKIMKEYSESGKTVFFSTHVIELAENLCDRLAIIKKGEIIFKGEVRALHDELKENNTLEEFFMELVEEND